jgi:hypothetical protein
MSDGRQKMSAGKTIDVLILLTVTLPESDTGRLNPS